MSNREKLQVAIDALREIEELSNDAEDKVYFLARKALLEIIEN